ncbi:MAG: SAM-dependent methyltransferase [Rhodobiaceae bacterium]|nr:SAM-dependent methyltransferase [Rhodobiaceae bacterium]MCC0056357.1 SAM-dependent methyltransferase [Rhodobiaceae bacterium]
MTDTILAAITDEIGRQGPMTVETYMKRCLEPYYAAGNVIGVDGDFTTAPEISQMFGEIIGAWVLHVHQMMGAPASFNLVELGPGRGALVRDIMRVVSLRPDTERALKLHLVETSPELRKAQRMALGQRDAVWHDDISSLPAGPSIIIANEFFDALPVRQFVARGGRWRERAVGMQGDGLAFCDIETADVPAGLPGAANDGAIAEWHQTGQAIAGALAHRLATDGGAMLVIDYGYEGPATGDTLQAVRAHAHADALKAPGTADLTTHVDFTQLRTAASAASASFAGSVSQGEFLSALGIGHRAQKLAAANPHRAAAIETDLARLVSPDAMGALFRVGTIYARMAAPPPFTSGN